MKMKIKDWNLGKMQEKQQRIFIAEKKFQKSSTIFLLKFMEEIKILRMEKEHLDEVALLHIEAFKDYPSTKLGKAYVKAFLKLFLESEFSIMYVAIKNLKVCGYVIGIENNKLKTKKISPIIFLSFLRKPYLIFDKKILNKIYYKFRNLLKIDKEVLPLLPSPFISLVGIGVAPENMGKGIGQNLMESFEQEAIKRGYKAMRLSVYNENLRAKKLYERCLWKPFPLPFNYLYYYKILNYDEK